MKKERTRGTPIRLQVELGSVFWAADAIALFYRRPIAIADCVCLPRFVLWLNGAR